MVRAPFATVRTAVVDPHDIAAVAAEALRSEARAEMITQMPAEYVAAFFDFYVTGTLDESPVRPTVQDVTGRAPRTFEQWATAHADAFARDGEQGR